MAERDIAQARVAKLERALRKALEYHAPGQVCPLTIREILMEGLRA